MAVWAQGGRQMGQLLQRPQISEGKSYLSQHRGDLSEDERRYDSESERRYIRRRVLQLSSIGLATLLTTGAIIALALGSHPSPLPPAPILADATIAQLKVRLSGPTALLLATGEVKQSFASSEDCTPIAKKLAGGASCISRGTSFWCTVNAECYALVDDCTATKQGCAPVLIPFPNPAPGPPPIPAANTYCGVRVGKDHKPTTQCFDSMDVCEKIATSCQRGP